tara:strand:- start:6336 stop:7388 length:1053 start_codon:yes stop_codon:yes gene_type:complete
MSEVNSLKLVDILKNLLENNTVLTISKKLNVASGTVKRWIELDNIPPHYTFDLLKLANIEIDYTKYSYKEKDQFFTPNDTALYCYEKAIEIINKYGDDTTKYDFIEPSAGNGTFLKLFPIDRRIGLDIEPKNDEIQKHDYLEWEPDLSKKYVTLGNPPFGLRGQLALKFINHSSKFSDYVCFILPQLFESDGKGVPRKRVLDLNLIHSEKLNTNFEYPDGKQICVECIFQVWSKYHVNPEYIIKDIDTSILKIYSLSDGGTPSSTRNKKMFNKCDIYLPSTCFGKDNMRYYSTFDELPRRKGYGIVFIQNKKENIKIFKGLDWSKIGFLSTNSAYNIRTSQIVEQFTHQG